MDDTGMWEQKYNTSVTEIKNKQDKMKMARLNLNGELAKMHEACKHLPDKKFVESVKKDCDISGADAYRQLKVYEELEWWPELVYNLKWSVIERIATSDLPQDWKKDLLANGDPNLQDKDWKKFFKDWTEDKIKPKDFEKMKKHKSDVREYRQRREIEQEEYIPYIVEQITVFGKMIDNNLTIDVAGKRRASEIVSLLREGFKELANILTTSSVPPSFNPRQKNSQN
jgi:hypothetical protein